MTRRDFLRRSSQALYVTAASSLGSAALSGCIRRSEAGAGSRARGSPIKVGILHSQTGTMAISETSLRDAELMAIEEINAAGGVLGRPIEAIVEDGRSRFLDIFPRRARKLLAEDHVAAVFGCWTSSSRKAVLPIFEELNGLLFYPVQYEGNESSPNIIYGGAVPNQQILPAIDWLLKPPPQHGRPRKRYYLIGSDYVYPRTANYIVNKFLPGRGCEVVGEDYTPLGHKDYRQVVAAIIKAEPDVILSTINGASNVHFYNELAARGIKAEKVPVVATSVGEDELRSVLPEKVEGHLAAWSYFQSVESPRNMEFVSRFKAEHGWDRVTDDPIESAYSQVHLWKLAVERAGAFDVNAVRAAFRSTPAIEFAAPGGDIRVDPRTQHTCKRFRMGRIRNDRQFDIVHESPEWIEPQPYPQVAFPGWSCDWTSGGMTRGHEMKFDFQ